MATHDEILDAWLTGIARDGWAGVRIDGVAQLGNVTTAEVFDPYPDRWAALRGLQARLDRAALGEAGSDRDAAVRDRLFAMIMARFDAAETHKAAVRQLVPAAQRDPGLAAFFVATLSQSAARIAEAAGVATRGWLGPLRVEALGLLILHVSRTWLDDADPELATTMKTLDTALERAERWSRFGQAA